MAKPIPSIKPLKGKDADRMIKYLQKYQPNPEWAQKQLEEDRKFLRDLGMVMDDEINS